MEIIWRFSGDLSASGGFVRIQKCDGLCRISSVLRIVVEGTVEGILDYLWGIADCRAN